MNIILQEFKTIKNLEQLLLALINYWNNYFKNKDPMSQNKTYAHIKKISATIFKFFPNIYAIENIAHKLIFNVGEKISDKYQNDKSRKNKQKSTISSLIQRIQDNNGESTESQQQSNFAWVRKALMDQIQLLKQDILDASQQLISCISLHLPSNSNIVLFDSFLNNENLITKIKSDKNLTIKNIKVNKNAQSSDIDLKNAPRQIKKSKRVIISSQLILKDGGVLAPSGSLMIATAAKAYGVPLIIISRGYCLSDKLLLGQSMLHIHENPLTHFDVDKSNFKVHIAKTYDYISSKYINLIITQLGQSTPQQIQNQYKKYYQDVY